MNRRRLIALAGGLALTVGLAGCTAYRQQREEDVVRRLLTVAAKRAFDRLLAPDGFWNDSLARLDLPGVGPANGVLAKILSNPAVHEQLQRRLNTFAEQAARRAAPAVTEAIRSIGWHDAKALSRGDPESATHYLRGQFSTRLVEIMVPQFADLLRMASDPVAREALHKLTGLDIPALAQTLAGEVDDAIWRAIGREEAAIRANPADTHDPVLQRVFGKP